jgi:pilus assembly protein Flp/PilA
MSMIIRAVALMSATLMHAKGRRDEKGATAVEYGLLVALIAVAIIVAVTTLGTDLAGMFEDVSDKIPGTDSAPLPDTDTDTDTDAG